MATLRKTLPRPPDTHCGSPRIASGLRSRFKPFRERRVRLGVRIKCPTIHSDSIDRSGGVVPPAVSPVDLYSCQMTSSFTSLISAALVASSPLSSRYANLLARFGSRAFSSAKAFFTVA